MGLLTASKQNTGLLSANRSQPIDFSRIEVRNKPSLSDIKNRAISTYEPDTQEWIYNPSGVNTGLLNRARTVAQDKSKLAPPSAKAKLAPGQSSIDFSRITVQPAKSLLDKAKEAVVTTAKNLAAPVIERANAVKESIATKSFEPLKKSFDAQNKEMFPQPGDTEEQRKNKLIGLAMGSIGAENEGANALKAAMMAKTAAKTVERGFVTSVKEATPELTSRVAGQYIPRSTDTLAIQAKNLIKDNISTAENLAKTGTNDKAVATAAELIKHYSDMANASVDTAAANTLYDKAAEIANTAARNLTEQGRAVQAASIMGRLTPEGVVRFAARDIQKYNEAIDTAGTKIGGFNPTANLKKIPELTGEQLSTLMKKAQDITEMPDGIEKAMAWHELQDHIAPQIPSSLYSKLVTVWKAGLLTGIKTSGLNTASNLFHGVSEIAKDVPAAAVDSVASLLTGKRTLALTSKGTGQGLVEGFGKGWRYIKTGFDERNIADKLDYKKVNFGTGPVAKAIQKYEETVFGVIGAEDQPFYYGAKTRSMQSQAIAEAKNQGLKGSELKDFVHNVVANPTDEMLKYATMDAETAVFQNKTALARAAKGIQNIPGGEFVVPFGKTPSAVAMQVLNYSPLGIVKTIGEQIANGKFDQRIFSQNLGRNLTGTAIMYLGTKLYDKGMLSLGRPTKESDIAQAQNEGKAPNSILINGKWRSANVLGPLGFTLLLGGYLAKGIKDTGSVTQGIIQMAAGLPKTLTDQTFLRGLDQFISAISDPAKEGATYFKGLLGSVVPTLVSDVARASDGTERRTPGLADTLKSRIPGLRKTLEPQVTTFGQKVQTPSFLETMADPTRPTVAKHDPVVSELKRLADAGFQATPTQVGDKNGYLKALTPEQNTQLWVRSGELLKGKLDKLIQTPQYQAMDDEQRKKAIDMFTDKAKLIARAEMVLAVTTGLQGQALKDKLSKLKAGGLMTKEVFNQYVAIR